VTLLYVSISYYLPFVLSLLACGRWGSAAKLLIDTSSSSRVQGVGVCLHPIGFGIWTSTPTVGASGTRLRKMCVFFCLECAWHGVGRCSDAGDLDWIFAPLRDLVSDSQCLLRSRV
jgi:hypothetical protein